jgi:two-component system, OmpR family, KDP operon response regulator KdpE
VTRPVVLIVDDEAPTRRYVSAYLQKRGYEPLGAADGTEALKLIAERPIDLVILDIGMPGPDGMEVLGAIRRDLDVPVIMLTARGREQDKVNALNQGADDYLTKPFGVEELLARVQAALRRTTALPRAAIPPYRHAGLEVDFSGRRVLRDGARIVLTQKEYEILAYLARNAPKVLTPRQILQTVWGGEYGDEAGYIWTYTRRIRLKIEPDPDQPRFLITEPGMGYSMPAPD